MKIKILITSVGSLVGQNIHDVLEYNLFYRRDKVEIIGTNSIASSPNNFRCDRCYLVSNTNTENFLKELNLIILKEKPDLILSGRDEDTEIVAKMMEANKSLKGSIPYGSSESLKIALNKWETSLFCNKYNLPFAATFVIGKSGGLNELSAFAELYSYPLIAKPIQGFASKGVYFIRNWEEVLTVSEYTDYMFQEYLGSANLLEKYFNQMDKLTPLFAHVPNVYHFSCHTVIAPDGSFDPVFISKNIHDSGVTVGFNKEENPELESITNRFVKAIFKEGGYGPVTVQFRKDKHEKWKAQEMNMRTNGNTFPRFLMGQDDIGLIIKNTLPEITFPVYHATEESNNFIVGKVLTSFVMNKKDINVFNENKNWNVSNV